MDCYEQFMKEQDLPKIDLTSSQDLLDHNGPMAAGWRMCRGDDGDGEKE